MTVEQESTTEPNFIATLADAAVSFQGKTGDRPAAKVVINALLQAEKAAKQQRLIYPLETLLGDWRLCFTTPGKVNLRSGMVLGKGFYVPQVARAQIAFNAQASNAVESSDIEISNSVQLGPLLLKLTGPARYLGKKNLLAFDFTQMQLLLFSRTVYSGEFRGGKATARDFEQQSIVKLPFFAFFLVTNELIAARGRGGGLALWVKEV